MAADEEFTRARCAATGAIASLPKEAVELGHIPGWEAVAGPLPETHKPNAFPKVVAEPAADEDQADDGVPSGEGGDEKNEEPTGGGEELADAAPAVARPGTKTSAGSKPSAKQKE